MKFGKRNKSNGRNRVRQKLQSKKSKVVAVEVREGLRNLSSPVNQQEKALGSQSLPHALHIGRQSRPFGDFQPFSALEFMGSDFKFGVGVRSRNCKKCRFYGIFAGVVHRSCQQKGVVTLGK